MNKRIAQAIADLELLRPALKGPHLMRLEMVMQNLMTESASAARMRKMRAKDKDRPEPGTHGKRHSDGNSDVTVTRNSDAAPASPSLSPSFPSPSAPEPQEEEIAEVSETMQAEILPCLSPPSELIPDQDLGSKLTNVRARGRNKLRANKRRNVSSLVTQDATSEMQLTASQKPETLTDGSKVWLAYAEAYERRWGAPPLRNAEANTFCARFARLVPVADAPHVAASYPRSRNSYYAAQKHPLRLMVKDAAKLHTEWVTGHSGTVTGAKRDDALADRGDVARELIEWARERDRAEEEGRLGSGET